MEEFVINIDQGKLDDLINEEIEFIDVLTEYFKSEDMFSGMDGGHTFASRLAYFHDSESGAPEVDDFIIDGVHLDLDSLTGYFTFCYDVFYFYGCSDINSTVEAEMKYNFTIDTESMKITCKAEFFGNSTYE